MQQGYGYIVERIVGVNRQKICFCGVLEICGLPCGLIPPLTLCRAEVVGIRTICCMGECTRSVELTLSCCVLDCKGKKAWGMAHIELDVSRQQCGGNVRIGARIEIANACFQERGFLIEAAIWIVTVATQAEAGGGCCKKRRMCTPLPPLYPAALCRRNGY